MQEKKFSISADEWFKISQALESFHAVFYKTWQMGKPVFTEKIETACVEFDKEGNFLIFWFNPVFWESLSFTNKLFVICHESLHVILNHGQRSTGVTKNPSVVNMCLDIVVNHLLVRSFGFLKEDLQDWQNYCWVDTIFPEKNFADDEIFEFYYNAFKDTYKDGLPGDGENKFKTVDSHEGIDSTDWSKTISNLDKSISEDEKRSLEKIVNKFGVSDQKVAGVDSGGWFFSKEKVFKKKKKWESVIKNWAKNRLKFEEKEFEQWTKLNRRLATLRPNLFLPSEVAFEHLDKNKDKIEIYFFLDTSGSCFGHADRFMLAAGSLSKKRFSVKLFSFDTKVSELSFKDNKFYGGGGTYFHILEQHIISNSINEFYPDAVFVITDGYGTVINPKFPKRWHWFLTEDGSKRFINQDCNFYELKEFE